MPDTKKIRELNDLFRRNPHMGGGKLMLTSGVNDIGVGFVTRVLAAVRTFDDFSKDNDPHHEHDFGAIEVDGNKCFFKIDYYDPSLEAGSEDPADPAKTTRVMIVMLAEEY